MGNVTPYGLSQSPLSVCLVKDTAPYPTPQISLISRSVGPTALVRAGPITASAHGQYSNRHFFISFQRHIGHLSVIISHLAFIHIYSIYIPAYLSSLEFRAH